MGMVAAQQQDPMCRTDQLRVLDSNFDHLNIPEGNTTHALSPSCLTAVVPHIGQATVGTVACYGRLPNFMSAKGDQNTNCEMGGECEYGEDLGRLLG